MSIIEHVTLQKIVAHDFRYDPRILSIQRFYPGVMMMAGAGVLRAGRLDSARRDHSVFLSYVFRFTYKNFSDYLSYQNVGRHDRLSTSH